jgi:hypothetical protein
MTTMLSGPEHLHVPCAGTGVCFGLDQDWFPGLWQRKAGCGPCTGANILLYLSRSGRLELPIQITDQGSFVSLMERSWEYLTPGVMGLNSPFMMQKGLDAFFESLGSPLKTRAMEIPGDTDRRPDPRLAEDFIRKGLSLDSPVAFLNLSNGDIPGLESWHWVTIVGLSGTGEEAVMNIYDNGKRLDVNLRRWLKTTKRDGGFVYVDIA